MAKTAQDYINQGADDAANGLPRPEGSSWQAKAQQKGYDGVLAQLGLPIANECTAEQPPIAPIPEQFRKTVESQHAYHALKSTQRKQSTVNAVQSHIDALYAQAVASNKPLTYAHKLGVKIQKIVDRWAKKGITFYVNKIY